MKKWDKIIIAILLFLSFIPYVLFKFLVGDTVNGTYAYITVLGEPYKELPLTGQVTRKEYIVETEKGKNIIVIENEKIAVIEATCDDQLCKDFGFISKPGEVIVCLPNQVYIEVRALQEEIEANEEVDIRVY